MKLLEVLEEGLAAERFAHRLNRCCDLALAKVCRSWDLVDLDLLFRQAFNIAQQTSLTRGGEGDCNAPSSGAPDPSNAVYVTFRSARDVVVHDVGEGVDIESSGRNIGGDEEFCGAVS